MFKRILCLMSFAVSVSLYGTERVATPVSVDQQVEAQQKVLIFDLGGIFFDLHSVAMGLDSAGEGSRLWGVYALAKHVLWNWNLNIEQKFFDTLNKFPLEPEQGFKRARTSKGTEMPYALCAYQAGRITSENLRNMAKETCDALSKQSFFTNTLEETIIRNIITGTFTPEQHAQYSYPLQGAIKMLERIAAQRNNDGSKKYLIVCLSNWDRESFEIVQKRYEKEFSYFDNRFISGYLNTVKPNDEAYQTVIKGIQEIAFYKKDSWVFSKKDCLLFDDQVENVEAARALGIESELVKRGDAQSLEAALKKHGILPA